MGLAQEAVLELERAVEEDPLNDQPGKPDRSTDLKRNSPST
jgi:hypothetical protein